MLVAILCITIFPDTNRKVRTNHTRSGTNELTAIAPNLGRTIAKVKWTIVKVLAAVNTKHKSCVDISLCYGVAMRLKFGSSCCTGGIF